MNFAQTIIRYVQLGFGIGLIGRTPGRKLTPAKKTAEIPPGHLLPHLPVHAVYRTTLNQDPIQAAFIRMLREQFQVTAT